MDIRVIETILAVASFFILRFAIIKFISKIQNKYDYSKYRMRPILKFINLVFIILITIIIAIWELNRQNFDLLLSVLAVISIICPMVYSFKHIFSTNHFISHPVKLENQLH
jgi:uncharacterized membrane protein YoaK (UPF0700 family)